MGVSNCHTPPLRPKGKNVRFVGNHPPDRAAFVVLDRFGAVAKLVLAAVGLQQAGKTGVDFSGNLGPHFGHDVTDLPLRLGAEPLRRDVAERGPIERRLQRRLGGVREDKAGVFRLDTRLQQRLVRLANSSHQRLVSFERLGVLQHLRGDHVRKIGVPKLDISLRLLVVRHADHVTNPLVTERPTNAIDAESEVDVVARAGVFPLVATLEEIFNQLPGNRPIFHFSPQVGGAGE